MDQVKAFKQTMQMIEETSNKLKVMHARIEDIQFRSLRIASWLKNQTNPRAVPPDRAFPDDLKLLRRDLKRFILDFQYLPAWLAKLERSTVCDAEAEDYAIALYRSASQFQKVVLGLLTPALIAHQHIRVAECKIDAWFLTQEIEDFAKDTVAVPLTCNKIVLKISTAPKPGPAPGSPPSPQSDARASVPKEDGGPSQ